MFSQKKSVTGDKIFMLNIQKSRYEQTVKKQFDQGLHRLPNYQYF